MGNNRIPFSPDCYYHLYNHGNGTDNIFRTDENYYYFLERYAHYINKVADTYAFCLMPNHFHFLIRMKEGEDILKLNNQGFNNLMNLTESNYDQKMSQQFSNFLNSYSKSYNKRYDRKGSLFLDNIKRKRVNDDVYFTRLIHYIHANPVLHGFVNKMEDWKFSSYESFLSNKNTQLKRDEVLKWFGGRDEYLKCHSQKIEKRVVLDFDF
jgi:putative transposase